MIEVQSDHQNLQGFMKQPRINGRQARWLIFLTLYDFIIRHRPGLLNPADGPSRRPDYIATAQKELSLIQKGLLAKKLVGPNSRLPEAVELYDAAKASSGLLKVGLYSDIDIEQLIQDQLCLEQQEAEVQLPRTVRGCTEREQSKYRQWVRLSLNSIKSQEDS